MDKQKPVAWMSDDGFWEYEQEGIDLIPLYTAPPNREWVGLTESDIKEGVNVSRLYEDQFKLVALWVEDKLKEKNT